MVQYRNICMVKYGMVWYSVVLTVLLRVGRSKGGGTGKA